MQSVGCNKSRSSLLRNNENTVVLHALDGNALHYEACPSMYPVILKAVYSAVDGSGWVDVTSEISGYLQDSFASDKSNVIHVNVGTAAIGKDPAPGKQKQLTVLVGVYPLQPNYGELDP